MMPLVEVSREPETLFHFCYRFGGSAVFLFLQDLPLSTVHQIPPSLFCLGSQRFFFVVVVAGLQFPLLLQLRSPFAIFTGVLAHF